MTEPSSPKVFFQPHFISYNQCTELIAKINDAPTHSTTVSAHGTSQFKGEIRRASKAEISDQPLEVIERKLQKLMPTLRAHFGISITGSQPLQLLRYQPGDFYKVHKDNGNLRLQEVGEAVPLSIANRKLTAVVFINGQVDSRDGESFTGGELVLHRKTSLNASENTSIPISAKPGLLVAFSSSTLHEFVPVVSGIRYSIVSWFG